jgi:Tfp pilus assembly protein PilN
VIKQAAIIRRESGGESPADAPSDTTSLSHDGLARDIAHAVAEQGLASNRIILGLSSRQVFVRHLTFPFSSSSKISQVLDFELEGMLPLPIGELVSVFTRQGKTRTGEQKVLTGSLRREELHALIRAFRREKLHVEVIDLAWHGMLALLDPEYGPVPDPLVVVDAGWSGTEVFLVSQGQIMEHRFVATGLSSFFSNPPYHDSATIELAPKDLEMWSAKISSLVNLCMIGWANAAWPATDARPEQIVLCGGGSLVQGLGPSLELAMHIPVQTMGELRKDFFQNIKGLQTPWSLLHHAAGLALRAKNQDAGLNFRIKEFAPLTTFRDRRKRMVHLAVCALVIVGVYLFTLASDVHHKNQQLELLEGQIQDQVAKILPDVRKGMRPSQYVSILKDRLAVFEAENLSDQGPGGSAIDILQAVSTLVDTAFTVTLDMLSLDGRKVRISGSADGFATVEAMKQRLQSSPFFDQVAIKGAKSVAQDGTVQFTLELDRG